MKPVLPTLAALAAAVAVFAGLVGREAPDLGTPAVAPAPRRAEEARTPVPWRRGSGRPAPSPWPAPPPPRGREVVGPSRDEPGTAWSGGNRRRRPAALSPALREELETAWRKVRGDEGSAPDLWGRSRRSRGDLSRLVALFPGSPLAESFSEYASIRGGTYWGYRLRDVVGDFKYRPEEEIPGFAVWVERYPGHPGQDDASYRLGRCFGIEGRGVEAVRWFQRAQTVPDGDMASAAETFELLFLDLLLSDDEVRELAESGDPRSGYSLGVRLLRAGDYRGARAWLGANGDAITGWTQHRAQAQVAAAGELGDLARAVRMATEPASRARALYLLGRRQYHDDDLYANLLWSGTWFGGRDSALQTAGVLALLGHDGAPVSFRRQYRAGHHRLQARETFLRLVRECPGSELVPAARYSAATALAHASSGRAETEVVGCPQEARIRAAREFYDFAREFPASTLADDALLTAARMTANPDALRTILGRYPGGDSAEEAEVLLERGWISRPDLDEVPAHLRTLAGNPGRDDWRAEHAVGRIERILGFCSGRILRLEGEERSRAVADLAEWFERYRGMLEFDPEAGAWLLF